MEETQTHHFTNRLAQSTSPYLLQHAHNPVDWYPWGTEALDLAKEENRPIFLSVGYSSCHWCHVMEEESFEDKSIAKILNEHFVPIKVDREERPDLDAIYMDAVRAMTGRGGWPLTVFLTPDRKPFYGGTYFPDQPRYGMPSFEQVLRGVIEIWETRREDVLTSADELAEGLGKGLASAAGTGGEVQAATWEKAVDYLLRIHDKEWGGFGDAPKFPQSAAIELLLTHYYFTGEREPAEAALFTLRRMARGGMYDQVGGGFHRYSVDAQWLVPHFEKMLYDNAQLAESYLHAFQLTGDAFYERVARQTLDYLLRDMHSEAGGFYAAQDADSEGGEGSYYVWTPESLRKVLGKDADWVAAFYGVTPKGNFESESILHIPTAPEAFAEEQGWSVGDLWQRLDRARAALLAARVQRSAPLTDTKVLTDWNAMAVSAFALAGRVLDDEKYLAEAIRTMDFLRTNMWKDDVLWHVYAGGERRIEGFLNDYALTASAALDVYEATLDDQWLAWSVALTERMIELFGDDNEPGFYFTSGDQADVIARRKPLEDGSTPSGNSVAADLLLRLGYLLGRDAFTERGGAILTHHAAVLNKAPGAFLYLLAAGDRMLRPGPEFAVIGPPDREDTQELVRAVYRYFVPDKTVAGGLSSETERSHIPLLKDRAMLDDQATVYVCERFTCKQPVTSPEELLSQVGAHARLGPATEK
jgi:hypothetical protein